MPGDDAGPLGRSGLGVWPESMLLLDAPTRKQQVSIVEIAVQWDFGHTSKLFSIKNVFFRGTARGISPTSFAAEGHSFGPVQPALAQFLQRFSSL